MPWPGEEVAVRGAMRRVVRAGVAVALGGALAVGLAACDGLPIELPTKTPDIDIPDLPTQLPVPPTVTVTAEPAPQPTVTVTAEPAPRPTVTATATVTAEPNPQPKPTATVTADPQPQPTVTVNVTPSPEAEPSVTPSPSPSVSPSVTPTAAPEPPAADEAMPWWPYLAGGIVLASLLAWWGIAAANRSAALKRFEAARSQVAWFEGTLAPHVLGLASAAEASDAWQEGRPLVLDIDRDLYSQSTSARSQVLRTAAGEGRIVLAELTAALDAEAVPDAPMDADALRARHARIEAARARVRAWLSSQVR